MQQNKLSFKSKYEGHTYMAVSLIKNKLTNQEIRQDLIIIEKVFDDLYQPFDKDIPILSQDKWDADYFYYQIACAELIFSKERIYHILEVRQYLRDQGVPELQYTPPPIKTSTLDTPKPPIMSNYRSSSPNQDGSLKTVIIGTAIAVVALIVLIKIF